MSKMQVHKEPSLILWGYYRIASILEPDAPLCPRRLHDFPVKHESHAAASYTSVMVCTVVRVSSGIPCKGFKLYQPQKSGK